MKLTSVQRSFLADAIRDGYVEAVESYPPLKELLAKGLLAADESDVRKFTKRYLPTPAALSQKDKG